MTHVSDRCRVFRQLHESGCFVIPNPWDLGSARAARPTRLSGARHDQLRVRLVAGPARQPACRSRRPWPTFDPSPGAWTCRSTRTSKAALRPRRPRSRANVAAATATGIAGLSIEDSTGDASNPLFDFTLAVERIQAARRAIDESGTGILLTGRSEGFIVGRPDLAETIRRLTAYAEAGADCLYAPGIRAMADIAAVVDGGRPQAGQRAGRQRLRHGGGARRLGRSPDQRWRRAGSRGLDRFPPGGEGNRRARDLHQSRPRRSVCRHQRALRPRSDPDSVAMQIEARLVDITTLAVDAIVNAANTDLDSGRRGLRGHSPSGGAGTGPRVRTGETTMPDGTGACDTGVWLASPVRHPCSRTRVAWWERR